MYFHRHNLSHMCRNGTHKRHPIYFALMGKLLGDDCEVIWENWLCYRTPHCILYGYGALISCQKHVWSQIKEALSAFILTTSKGYTLVIYLCWYMKDHMNYYTGFLYAGHQRYLFYELWCFANMYQYFTFFISLLCLVPYMLWWNRASVIVINAVLCHSLNYC